MKKLILLTLLLTAVKSQATTVSTETYKLMQDGHIMRESDGGMFTVNPDYIKFLADLKAGAKLERFDQAAEDKRQSDEQKKIKKEVDIKKIDLAISEKAISMIIPIADGDTAKVSRIRGEITALEAQKHELEK